MSDLMKYAKTDNERAVIAAYLETGCGEGAARKLGKDGGNVRSAIRRVKNRAAQQGHSPDHDMTKTVPDGFKVKGVSTLYDADGNAKIQWVKSSADRERQEEMMREAIAALCEDITPVEPLPKPQQAFESVLTVYPFGDPHIGLHSWHEETGGEDYDLKAAEHLFTQAMRRAVSNAPSSEHALIVNVGDYFHSDSMDNKTRRSGNALDVDSRYSKIIRIGVKIMKSCITQALGKHQQVTVINANGNHDEHSSQWLQVALDALYSEEPRVDVRICPAFYQYYTFGQNLIGITHGDQCKPADLEPIMAADRPKEWGDSRHRYWYTGHVHHDQIKEYRGCKFESFRTLAAKDAWHSGAGYRSDRDLKVIILHKDHGEVERYTINITQFQEG